MRLMIGLLVAGTAIAALAYALSGGHVVFLPLVLFLPLSFFFSRRR
jgi:F0F1-type ATP synthase assembly protein I